MEEGEVWVVGFGEIEVGERLDACGVAVVEEGVFEVFAHVGWGDVGEGFVIFKSDGGVDLAFGVDDDADFFEGDLEKDVGFEDFEGFVEQEGGFDGDFGAHLVARVGEGLFEGGVGDLFAGPAEEGAAGTGEEDLFDWALGAGFENFVDGVVFGVDGDHIFGVDFGAGDEGFLVGEEDFFAEGLGTEGWFDADEAGEEVDDDIGFGEVDGFEGVGGDLVFCGLLFEQFAV